MPRWVQFAALQQLCAACTRKTRARKATQETVKPPRNNPILPDILGTPPASQIELWLCITVQCMVSHFATQVGRWAIGSGCKVVEHCTSMVCPLKSIPQIRNSDGKIVIVHDIFARSASWRLLNQSLCCNKIQCSVLSSMPGLATLTRSSDCLRFLGNSLPSAKMVFLAWGLTFCSFFLLSLSLSLPPSLEKDRHMCINRYIYIDTYTSIYLKYLKVNYTSKVIWEACTGSRWVLGALAETQCRNPDTGMKKKRNVL